MYTQEESVLLSIDLSLHIIMNNYHRIDRKVAEDLISYDILEMNLPPLTQKEVDFAFDMIETTQKRVDEK